MAPFKLPIDAYILAVPMTYAGLSLGAMVYNALAHDPDMRNYAVDQEPLDAMRTANAYHNNPVKRYFEARFKAHSSLGVFDNEVTSAR